MKFSAILLVLLFGINGYAQNAEEIIMGLKSELTQKPSDARKAAIYSDLTWYYANVAVDSALAYGNRAINESVKLGDSVLLAQVYSDLGAVHFRNTDFVNSKKAYLKAYQIRKKRKDFTGLAKINNNLANIYMNTHDYKNAMKAYLETLAYFEKIKDVQNQHIVKANIGQLYTDLRDYTKSIKYLSEALAYYEKVGDKVRLCESYLNLGKAYESKGDLSNAEKFYRKSMLHCGAVGNKKATGILYQSLAIIQSKQNKDSLAVANLKKSDSITKTVHVQVDEANLKITLARTLIKEQKFAEAKKVLSTIKKVFADKNSVSDLLYTYRLLIPVCAHLNQPDSVAYYNDKHAKLFEKLVQQSVIKQTAELEAKYQSAKKEQLLFAKEAESKRKTNWIIIISLLAAFIGITGYLIFRQQKLKNQQQQHEFELQTAIAQIETQNKLQEQRLAISRDLHDNIGAQLTFVISSVDNLKYANANLNEKVMTQLTRISEFTRSTIVELRDTIWAMNATDFTFDDIKSRIMNFIEKAKSAQENCTFVMQVDALSENRHFSSLTGINIYRTMQEAVNNAIKYANAKTISVLISAKENLTQIQIEDDGKGFDFDTVSRGNGLHNMRKRIEEVGGEFVLKSYPGKGTSIKLVLKNDMP